MDDEVPACNGGKGLCRSWSPEQPGTPAFAQTAILSAAAPDVEPSTTFAMKYGFACAMLFGVPLVIVPLNRAVVAFDLLEAGDDSSCPRLAR